MAIEKGQIPSWLLTLYPVRAVAIMGKSEPLASPVGYLSLRCAVASVQTAAPRNACEICVRVRFRAHCWELNQTGPLIQGVHSAVPGLFAFMRFFQQSPAGASLSVWRMYTTLFHICGATRPDATATKTSSSQSDKSAQRAKWHAAIHAQRNERRMVRKRRR